MKQGSKENILPSPAGGAQNSTLVQEVTEKLKDDLR
jgi:hypothetical protein